MDGARTGTWGNCVINSWRVAASAAEIRRVEEVIEAAYRDFPSGVVFVLVVESVAPMPTPEQRRDLESTYMRCAPMFRCVAQVVLGTGMRSIMVQSALAALRLMHRRPYPSKVLTSLTEAVVWVEPHLEPPGGVSVLDPVQGLRAALDRLVGQP